jgi:hypothetical protein
VTNSSCEANYLAFRKRTMLFEIFVKRGGGRVPPSFWSGVDGHRIIPPPPHFLTCLMKFRFLVIQKYLMHGMLFIKNCDCMNGRHLIRSTTYDLSVAAGSKY